MSKSNYAVRVLQFLVVIACASYSVSAQLIPGMVDMKPSINTTINNSINTARTRILSGRGSGGSSAANQRTVSAGQQKIRAGRATTTFTTSAATTKGLAQSLNWDDSGPFTLPEQITSLNNWTARFNRMVSENGLTVNDSVDARVMAYAIASYISTSRKPSPNSLKQMRENYRREFLNDPYYQGASDQVKQETYQIYALYAIQAIEEIEKSQQGRSNSEKQKHRNKGLFFANEILAQIRK